MKNIISIIGFICISSSLYATTGMMDIEKVKATELGWVDEQIRAIIPARIGVSNQDINSLSEPFLFVKEPKPAHAINAALFKPIKKVVVKAPLKLALIINSKALIDNKWYQKGDILDGYTVESISSNSVTLVKGKSVQVLTIKSNSSNLRIKTK